MVSASNPIKNWNKLWSAIKHHLKAFLFFVGMYAVVNHVLAFFTFWANSHLVLFLTSPFNDQEIASPEYASIREGLFENYLIPASMIVVAPVSNLWLQNRNRMYPTPWRVFLSSVVATYIVSALVWLKSGLPATGTSVIATCMAVLLLVYSVDGVMQASIKREKEKEIAQDFTHRKLSAVLLAFCFAFSLVTSCCYLLDNPAFKLHLLGGGICLGIVGLCSLGEKRQRSAALSPDRS